MARSGSKARKSAAVDCPRCGLGIDDDADGNCAICAHWPDEQAASVLATFQRKVQETAETWKEVPHMNGLFIASSKGRIAKITGCCSNGYIEVTVPGRILVHIDGNKTNNDPNNLEWSDQHRNMQHMWDAGERKITLTKYTEEQYRKSRELFADGRTYKQIAEELGMTAGGVEYAVRDSRRFR